jgi:DEAD/DEAH box helicase
MNFETPNPRTRPEYPHRISLTPDTLHNFILTTPQSFAKPSYPKEIFLYSPFGMCCIHPDCPNRPTIEADKTQIQRHLRKHNISDRNSVTVNNILTTFNNEVEKARESNNIEEYRYDNKTYDCYTCICGEKFPNKKGNAIRHCKKKGCDIKKISTDNVVKLRCGRFVTNAQLNDFFRKPTDAITKQFDYNHAREVLEPLLPDKEKRDHTYTHMYAPLIFGCDNFLEKIKSDHDMIHSPPSQTSEGLLVLIHEQATKWILHYAQNNILMIPGNLRSGLQTFEGSEVNETKQKTLYTMQHDPSSILPELKKLLSFSYRRQKFAKKGFDTDNDFEVATYLKDLLLEETESVSSHPFIVEFCLMYPFRCKNNKLSMISCDTVSSVFSKMLSACKAGVCSVICSFTKQAFRKYGHSLVSEVRESSTIHILCPMLRQIREMNGRIPKRRKTTLDLCGNITVDQFFFPFDIWTSLVPRTIEKIHDCIKKMALGHWWEPVIDLSNSLPVSVDDSTGDIQLIGVTPIWKQDSCLPLDELDTLTALFEMSFHGFGGGSARRTELENPTMFHCLFTNHSIYYSCSSLKVFNNASRKYKEVERKLPPIISRYYILFRSLIQSNVSLFPNGDIALLLPYRKNKSEYTLKHVIRDFFNFDSLPDMTQVRHFWAGVSNWVTGGLHRNNYVSSSEIGAKKMGHTTSTHEAIYSNEIVGRDEPHFKTYHIAIGDSSYDYLMDNTILSIACIRKAMSIRYPLSDFSDGHNYLSLQQKELVEFSYGSSSHSRKHCIALLAPGEGKSECFIIPTIARHIANQTSKTIIYVSPYGFLSSYQNQNVTKILERLQFNTSISTVLYTGSDITEGVLPETLTDKHYLPPLIFLSLDAIFNLFTYYNEYLKTWIDVVDKIVIDELHTLFSEKSFRVKYEVYSKLSSLGIPIVALSGSIPLFAYPNLVKRIGMSCKDDLTDLKVIQGGDVIGNFPTGFCLKVAINPEYMNLVESFVIKRLKTSTQSTMTECIHIFVAEKGDGSKLLKSLTPRYNCRLVTSETSRENVTEIASEWAKGIFQVLISTSIALVGNENPNCCYLACAGYFYDLMQTIQFFGRLRGYMRKPHGEILFSAPRNVQENRLMEDKTRFKRLVNDRYLTNDDYSKYQQTMTSGGVREWLIFGSTATNTCALQKLSEYFGKKRSNCGICLSCRSGAVKSCQITIKNCIESGKKNEQASERVLRRLALVCIACNNANCRGIPILQGKGSRYLAENRDCCFSWHHCYKCGVSSHDRKTHCFDRSYMNNVACSECWVFKNIHGSKRHEITECEVKGRLRRLLSHNYLVTVEKKTFQQYIEEIYTSKANFCAFMSFIETKYMQK